MTIVLTVLGSILILSGLVVLFGRGRDASGETKFKFKDIEIASAKPSIVLVILGSVLVVVPHVTKKSEPAVPDNPFDDYVVPQPQDTGSRCCTPGLACPLVMPGVTGTACTCWDMMGNMAMGTVCK